MPSSGQHRAVQQRCGKCTKRHQSEQDEGRSRREEAVKRIGGIDRPEGDGGAGRGQDGGDVGDRKHLDGRGAFLAPGPLAGREQSEREGAAQQGPHARPEQAGIDRVADHEEAAERQCQPTQPHHPARADPLLEAGRRGRKRRGRRRCLVGSVFGRGGRCFVERRRSFNGDGEGLGFKCGRRLSFVSGHEWRRGRLRAPSARLKRIEPRLQGRGLIHRLARHDQRDHRDCDRKEFKHLVPTFRSSCSVGTSLRALRGRFRRRPHFT